MKKIISFRDATALIAINGIGLLAIFKVNGGYELPFILGLVNLLAIINLISASKKLKKV